MRNLFFVYLSYVFIGCQGNYCGKVQLENESYLFERLGVIITKDDIFSEYLDKQFPLINKGKYYRNFAISSLNSSNFNYQDSIKINSIIDTLKNENLFINSMTIGRSKEILFTIKECEKNINGQRYSFKNTVVYNYKNRDPFSPNVASYKIYSDSILSERIKLVYLSMSMGY